VTNLFPLYGCVGSHQEDSDVHSHDEFDENEDDNRENDALFSDSDDDGKSARTLRLQGNMDSFEVYCSDDDNASHDEPTPNFDDDADNNFDNDDGNDALDTTPAPRRSYRKHKCHAHLSPSQKRRRILQKHTSDASDVSHAY
jgi:hypothetical protein